MYDAPASRRPLPFLGAIGEERGPWMAEIKKGDLANEPKPLRNAGIRALAEKAEQMRADAIARGSSQPPLPLSSRPGTAQSIASSAACSSMMVPTAGVRLDRRRKPVAGAPWESFAVQQFARKTGDTAAFEAGVAPSAMVMQGPGGSTVLQAVGDPKDHKVAGHTVANLQQSSPQAHGARNSQLVAVQRGQSAPVQKTKVSFGAVYEHRDMAGKPKLIGSTGVMPEHQFQLDWQNNNTIKDLSRQGGPGSSGRLVWVGIGSGPVGEEEMSQVRQAVVNSRAERLNLEKLSSEKPYSRHS